MLIYLKSLVVLIPIIIGLIRFRQIDRSYRPFIYLVISYFINESINHLSAKLFRTNAVPYNIFSLFECLLICYQFYVWGFLKKRKQLFLLSMGVLALLWSIENLFFFKITQFSPYFRVFYAFIVVLLSVNQINFLIIHDSKNLLKNAKFLICVGFVILFMYQILYEGSLFINQTSANRATIARVIISLFADMNIFINLLFAVAVFFIPKKETLPFTLDKLD